MIPPKSDNCSALRVSADNSSRFEKHIYARQVNYGKRAIWLKSLEKPDSPQIVVQALLTFGDKTSEGRLVQAGESALV